MSGRPALRADGPVFRPGAAVFQPSAAPFVASSAGAVGAASSTGGRSAGAVAMNPAAAGFTPGQASLPAAAAPFMPAAAGPAAGGGPRLAPAFVPSSRLQAVVDDAAAADEEYDAEYADEDAAFDDDAADDDGAYDVEDAGGEQAADDDDDDGAAAAGAAYGEEDYEEPEQPAWYEVFTGGVDGHITAVAFDCAAERVWCGTSEGQIVSLMAPTMTRYSAVYGQLAPVTSLLTLPLYGLRRPQSHVLSVSNAAVRLHSDGGLLRSEWLFKSVFGTEALPDRNFGFTDACLLNSSTSVAVVGTAHQRLMIMDVSLGQRATRTVLDVRHPVQCLYSDAMLVAGCGDGFVSCFDPELRTRGPTISIQAHLHSVSDLVMYDNYMITCGTNVSAGMHVNIDTFLNVFDIRTMQRVDSIPLSLPEGPSYLVALPHESMPALVAISMSGAAQYVEYGSDGYTVPFAINTNGGAVLSASASTTGELVAIGTSFGVVHCLSDRAEPHMCMHTLPVPTPTDATEALLQLEAAEHPRRPITVDAPGGPSTYLIKSQTGGMGASDFPEYLNDILVSVHTPKKVTPELMARAQNVDKLQYLQNPGYLLNSMLFGRGLQPVPFTDVDPRSRSRDDIQPTPGTIDKPGQVLIPRPLRRPRLKLSKLGLSDFDFGAHNNTIFAGLEDSGPNSFVNAVLQTLYFEPYFRTTVQAHLCELVNCLTCELRFLFGMLDHAQRLPAHSRSCQAANFLRVLRRLAEPIALGILDPSNLPPVVRIQRFTRFLMERVEKETHLPPSASTVSRPKASFASTLAFGTPASLCQFPLFSSTTCAAGHTTHLDTSASMVDLVYPEDSTRGCTFAQVLQAGLAPSNSTKAWCQVCKVTLPVSQRKWPTKLPHMLMVNSACTKVSHTAAWRQVSPIPGRRWLPLAVWIRVLAEGGVEVVEEPPMDLTGWSMYQLVAMVSLINQSSQGTAHQGDAVVDVDEDAHFVAHCAVGADGQLLVTDYSSSPARAEGPSSPVAHAAAGGMSPTRLSRASSFTYSDPAARPWVCFNDFRLTNMKADQAIDFSDEWRLPCTLMYRCQSSIAAVAPPLAAMRAAITAIPEEVFGTPPPGPARGALALPERLMFGNGRTIPNGTLPGKGDLVAIDAEFVVLDLEEAEVKPNGLRVVRKQARLAPGRISCLAVESVESKTQTVIIDSFILSTERVVDYLTRFSGLAPGDLEPVSSRHTLVDLKTTYLQLQCLVDRGCIFVGHGVAKDFRTINLAVPDAQVRDTVELFHLPNQRKISLRFLAAFFLGIDIQATTHDSVEDARTTMQLYQKYEELRKNGTLLQTLQEMYDMGYRTDWKSAAGIELN